MTGPEHILRIEPAGTPRATILIVPPLFEEANRTRRTLVLAMRALAAQGFAALLPDLPGQNESLVPLVEADLLRWQDALAEVASGIDGPAIIASFRGGALIDHKATAKAWWRLAPVGGASLLRTLMRARVSADRESGIASSLDALQDEAKTAPLLLAGNRLSPAMMAGLGTSEALVVQPLRSVGLGADGIAGTPLWLRAEPGEVRSDGRGDRRRHCRMEPDMRHQLSFDCEGAALAASLDEAAGATGLLIVSGGNEVRSGAHRGMAMLAARIADAGHPVFRFDRRGVGDSEGANGGFESSAADIAAAIAAFREAAPQVSRIIAFGNCDAASALLLHQPLTLDGLILANPWTYDSDVEETDEPALPPATAIRARYLARLKDPKSLLRLFKGEVDFRKLFRGLSAIGKSAPPSAPDSLPGRLDAAMAKLPCPATILLATGDRTAQAFVANCSSGAVPVERLVSPSHSFAGDDAERLAARILAALK